jgi:hypothetical protein
MHSTLSTTGSSSSQEIILVIDGSSSASTVLSTCLADGLLLKGRRITVITQKKPLCADEQATLENVALPSRVQNLCAPGPDWFRSAFETAVRSGPRCDEYRLICRQEHLRRFHEIMDTVLQTKSDNDLTDQGPKQERPTLPLAQGSGAGLISTVIRSY